MNREELKKLKPWELGRSINGHTLPPGASWHRIDGWTEEMLPDGYRPLMDGEVIEAGDDGITLSGRFAKYTVNIGQVAKSHSRTTRPIPFTLTKEQIADGWLPWNGGECPVEPESMPTVMFRDLTTNNHEKARVWTWTGKIGCMSDIIAYRPDPYGKFRQALADGRTIQCYDSFYKWVDLESPAFDAPPDQYRVKEPKWLPLGPEDVPPGSVFRNVTRAHSPVLWWSIRFVTDEGVAVNDSGGIVTFAALEKGGEINRPRHRDADGNPTLWEPCRKEAKPHAATCNPDIVAEQQEVEAAQDENSTALQTVANSRPEIPPYRDSYTASH